MVSFEELGLNMSIVKAVKEIGMENPFPIQEHCIPLILKGKDVIGQAHTGTGKTAAFSLPIISSLKSRGPIQALSTRSYKRTGHASYVLKLENFQNIWE